MPEFYLSSDVVRNLWAEYQRTPEFKNSKYPLVGIRQDHPIIVKREEDGLDRILKTLKQELSNTNVLYLRKLQERRASHWLKEWLTYHKTLFSRVLRVCGVFRRKDVWFDTLEASEKDYKIPQWSFVPSKLEKESKKLA